MKKKVGSECEKGKGKKFRLKRDSTDRVNVKQREGMEEAAFCLPVTDQVLPQSFATYPHLLFLRMKCFHRAFWGTRRLPSSFRCSLLPLSVVAGSASLFGPLFGTGNDLDCFGRKVVGEKEEEEEKT